MQTQHKSSFQTFIVSSKAFLATTIDKIVNYDYSPLNKKLLDITGKVTGKLELLETETRKKLLAVFMALLAFIFLQIFSFVVTLLLLVIVFEVCMILDVHHKTHIAQQDNDRDISQCYCECWEKEVEDSNCETFGSISTLSDDQDQIDYSRYSENSSTIS